MQHDARDQIHREADAGGPREPDGIAMLISRPLASSSGRPEFRGLIAASSGLRRAAAFDVQRGGYNDIIRRGVLYATAIKAA